MSRQTLKNLRYFIELFNLMASSTISPYVITSYLAACRCHLKVGLTVPPLIGTVIGVCGSRDTVSCSKGMREDVSLW